MTDTTLHSVDATSTAVALPEPDAPPISLAEIDTGVNTYLDRERTASEQMLVTSDADCAAVRNAVPIVLAKYAGAIAAVDANDDLHPMAKQRQRAALMQQQGDELAQLAPRLQQASARAKSFGVPTPATEADAREVTALITERRELAPRFFLPVLAERVRAAAATGVGTGMVRALLPYLKSWYDVGPDALKGDGHLWALITRAEKLTADRGTLYADGRLREIGDLQYKLSELVQRPDSLSYGAWGVAPPPAPPLNRGALQAASMGPLEAALLAQGARH